VNNGETSETLLRLSNRRRNPKRHPSPTLIRILKDIPTGDVPKMKRFPALPSVVNSSPVAPRSENVGPPILFKA